MHRSIHQSRHATTRATGFLLALFASPILASGEDSCMFRPVQPVTADPVRNHEYVAQGSSVALVFYNEDAPTPAKNFPDPRLTIRQLRESKSCEVADESGVWAGEKLYLDSREHVALLEAYNGSSSTLLFFDTRTCARIAQLDVSDRKWAIVRGGIRTGAHCSGDSLKSCRNRSHIDLTRDCTPRNPSSKP